MKRLEFSCAYNLIDKIESLIADIDDDNLLISVYGKYDVIKTIFENLIADGFSIADEIELETYDISYYDKEFVLYITQNGINVEKTYQNDSYLYDDCDISFVHEDCSSALLKYIESDKIYEFGYISENEDDDSGVGHKNTDNDKKSDNERYSVSIKCNLDADEALRIIKDMENRMTHMNDMFREMDCFRCLFN